MFIDKEHIKVTGLAIWDGISKPERQDDGSLKHNIKISIPAGSPELAELDQLARTALAGQRFNGNLPPGANWPLKEIDPAKFGDTAALVTGHTGFNAGTSRGVPQMFDAAGGEMAAMSNYGHVLYAGSTVSVIVHAYDYSHKGNQGIAFGLDGIMIVDAATPKLDVSSGLSSAAIAAGFGIGGAAAPAPVPVSAAPAAPAPAAPVAAPAPAPAPAAPAAPVMTAKAAGTTYEAYTAAGWTLEQLVADGLALAPGTPVTTAVPPTPGFLTPPGA